MGLFKKTTAAQQAQAAPTAPTVADQDLSPAVAAARAVLARKAALRAQGGGRRRGRR